MSAGHPVPRQDCTDSHVTGIAAVEKAVRERVAREIVDIRRSHSDVKGSVGSTKRFLVNRALADAALRVLTGEHDEDVYPADWLDSHGIARGDS